MANPSTEPSAVAVSANTSADPSKCRTVRRKSGSKDLRDLYHAALASNRDSVASTSSDATEPPQL